LQNLTLAHISDLHIGPLPRPSLGQLAGKRITGFLSWRLRRANIHHRAILERLADDLTTQRPDHVAVTGDLVNIALPEEFRQAREFLGRIGGPERVTVIPGNHDAYVPLPWSQSLGLWEAYMTGRHGDVSDAGGARPPRDVRDFPFLQRIGDVALIGLSTALPTVPFSAAGELGTAQLQVLDRMLETLGREDVFRVVLIHHPPFSGGAYRRKSLRDAADFARTIAARGAELVLHGHMHISSLGRLPGPIGSVPVIGVPSASAVAVGKANHKDPSRYHIYRISRAAPGAPWQLEVSIREWQADGSGFAPAGEITLLGAGTSAGDGGTRGEGSGEHRSRCA